MGLYNGIYKDPTFEAACRLEINEKGCAVCVHGLALTTGDYRCGMGKRFPFCKGNKNGFKLDTGDG